MVLLLDLVSCIDMMVGEKRDLGFVFTVVISTLPRSRNKLNHTSVGEILVSVILPNDCLEHVDSKVCIMYSS